MEQLSVFSLERAETREDNKKEHAGWEQGVLGSGAVLLD